jgi:plasmid stabilization system protein ParE
MGEVRWTEEAIDWLERIFDFIAQDKPIAAEKSWMAYMKRPNC